MPTPSNPIISHYHRGGLFEAILRRLQESGVDLASVTPQDLAPVDEFHVRGAAVTKELSGTVDLKGKQVLDIGCGLGGPCRFLATEYGCQVTGIDLSPEFIRTARALTKLVGLDGQITFLEASATNLPFPDAHFDVTWTQHVQMNVANKQRFYSEMSRVLRPGGQFLYYDIFYSGTGTVTYPMPWATDASHSYLSQAAEVHALLADLGFRQKSKQDQTQAGIAFFEKVFQRLATEGPPPLGLHLIMGESTQQKLGNLLAHLREGALVLESGVVVK
jgi:ubiquinone/menaquinone biosynthesis C-methylase UbiE